MSVTTFYLVRHGETESNAKHILQGQTNSNLTELGKKQAKELVKKLKGVRFDLAHASDLTRAHDTAKIISKPHRLKVKTNQALREKSFGKFEGYQTEKFEKELAEVIALREKMSCEERFWHLASPEIEVDGLVAARMRGFLEKTAQTNPGTTNLVVSHGATIRVFLISIGFADYQQLNRGSIGNCGYARVEFANNTFQVTQTHQIQILKLGQA